MKVIFLDIDGVLNTSSTFENRYYVWKKTGYRGPKIDEFRVKLLSEIINKTDAKIVLTSIWKSGYKKENNQLIPINPDNIMLDNMLNKYGLYIYDITPDDKLKIRQNEINEWLSKHDDIDAFVVIDDDTKDLKDFIGKELIKTNFLKKDGCEGLCECHVDDIINILNNKKLIKNNIV